MNHDVFKELGELEKQELERIAIFNFSLGNERVEKQATECS